MPAATTDVGLRGRLAERAWFSDTKSWLWHVYHRLLGRFSNAPMPFRGAATGLRVPQFEQPIYVRLGTADIIILRTVIVEGEYDELCRRKAELGDVRTILDLGVNVGVSVRIWQREFPTARIVGVEPDAANIAVAKRNAAVGSVRAPGKVDLLRAAAVGTSRPVFLETAGLDPLGFRARDIKAGEPGNVEGLSVDDLCARYGIDGEIDLLKCDIEGGEVELIRTPGHWLDRVRNLLIEIHPPYTRADLEADLAKAGVPFDFVRLSSVNGYETLLGRRRSGRTSPTVIVNSPVQQMA